MDDNKAGVAVLVKSKGRYKDDEPFKDVYLFGAQFENIAECLSYLQFLESRNTEFIVQIGFVGWRRNEENN